MENGGIDLGGISWIVLLVYNLPAIIIAIGTGVSAWFAGMARGKAEGREDLLQMIEVLQGTVDALKEDRDRQERRITNLEETNEKLYGTNKELTEKVSQQECEISQLRTDYDALQKSYSALKLEHDELRKAYDEVQSGEATTVRKVTKRRGSTQVEK